MAKPEKAPKAPKKAAKKPEGGGLFRLLMVLAIVGGVGYAAMRLPIGGKTLFGHAAGLLDSDVLAKKASEAGRGAKEAIARVTEGAKAKLGDKDREKEKAPEKAPEKPAAKKAPEKPKVADLRSGRPAEKLTREERDALDRLVR